MKTITTKEIMSLYKKANANPNQETIRRSINTGSLKIPLANHSITSKSVLNKGTNSLFRQY